jgi:hypothetical protein
MIPPPPPSLLENNPQFATLHNILITKHLDHDASSRARNDEYEGTAERLRASREQLARERVLLGALGSVASGSRAAEAVQVGTGQSAGDVGDEATEESSVLTEEEMDLIGLMVQYIASSPELTAEEHELMRVDTTAFREILAPVVGAGKLKSPSASLLTARLDVLLVGMEARLRESAMAASDALSVSAPSPSSTLEHNFQRLLHHNRSLASQTLPTHLLVLTTSTTSLLAAHSTNLTTSRLPQLESTVYGAASEARLLVARADFDKAVARGLRAKAEVLLKELERDGTVDGQDVLERIDAKGEALLARKEELMSALEEYESAERGLVNDAGGPARAAVLKKLGRRYGDIENEIMEVKGDIERLRAEDYGSTRETRVGR